MVEEVGELARALRKRENLTRHGSYSDSDEAHELADVFLYVVHMANVLNLDLAGIVKQKEFINLEKFLGRQS
jgi:NTP pyrophosphatase (non-canonical NTP hydrolase)